MKVTLKTIADRANVSIASVSRALNKDSITAPIHDDTRMRILQIAKEMGYHKLNESMQKNEKNRRNKIGLVMHLVKDKYQDPYFSEIMYGIESELMEHGSALEFTYEMQDVLRSDLFANMDKQNLGVFCVGPLKSSLLQELKSQVPLVVSVGGLLQPEMDCVTVDFRRAAREAVQYIIHLGHRSIAFIGGGSNVGASLEEEERFLGYREAMKQNDLPVVSEWICEGKFDMAESYEVMMRILKSAEPGRRPTAVFTASDKMAYGAYKAIQELGLSIPDDISVISFDDIEMSEFVNPRLTTVRVHKEEMGRIAVKLMLERMDNNITVPLNTLLPTELIVRDSCMKASFH